MPPALVVLALLALALVLVLACFDLGWACFGFFALVVPGKESAALLGLLLVCFLMALVVLLALALALVPALVWLALVLLFAAQVVALLWVRVAVAAVPLVLGVALFAAVAPVAQAFVLDVEHQMDWPEQKLVLVDFVVLGPRMDWPLLGPVPLAPRALKPVLVVPQMDLGLRSVVLPLVARCLETDWLAKIVPQMD